MASKSSSRSVAKVATASLPVTAETEAALARYAEAAAGAFASNTERAIRSDTALFVAWCSERGLRPLPAEPSTVARFVREMAEVRAVASVGRYVSSIAHAHRAAGLESPTVSNEVRLALKSVRRAKGVRQRQAAPLTERAVDVIRAQVGSRLLDARDVALVMVARDTLARRSELVALDMGDIAFAEDGSATALIRRSKTDSEGRGDVRFVGPDAVLALREWIERAGVVEGPLFRAVNKGGKPGGGRLTAGMIPRIFKRLAGLARLDASGISGHSSRVGMVVDLVSAGAELPALQPAGGWKTPSMPAKYAERLLPRRGAVANFYRRSGRYGGPSN